MEIKTLRIWVLHNGSWVKLSLKEGQTITLCEGGPTDEGWSWKSRVITREGGYLFEEYTSDGKDCDGRLCYYYDYYVNIFEVYRAYCCVRSKYCENLPEQLDNECYVSWVEGKKEVYDQFAQAAGY